MTHSRRRASIRVIAGCRKGAARATGAARPFERNWLAFACALLMAYGTTPSVAQQLPTGGAVAAGSATIAAPSAGTLNINQSTNQAIINWNTFSIGRGGTVNFFGGCASGTSVHLDTGLLHYSSLTLMASFHHTPGTIRRALEFIEEGIVHSRDFVDGECALTDLPELFKSMAAGNHAVKTLVRVRE